MIRIHCPLIDLVNDEVKQIFNPGIQNSKLCTLVSEEDAPWKAGPYKLWIKDGNDPKTIPADVLLIHGSYGKTDNFQEFHDRHPQLPIIMVDYKDHPDKFYGTQFLKPKNKVTHFKRSMVDTSKSSIYKFSNIDVHHAPYCVREDLLDHMQNLDFERDINVSCFFPPKHETDFSKCEKYTRTKDNPKGHARGFIAEVVDYIDIKNKHVGPTASTCQNKGRQGIDLHVKGSMQNRYAELMKRSKIIVTACPSNYEGDYRLFEAMSSGALVLHNRMTLPPYGLVEDKHWVCYDNSSELINKIYYYNDNPDLASKIGSAGREFVINNHRPHHRIEYFLKTAGIL